MQCDAARDELVMAHLFRCRLLARSAWRKIGHRIALDDLAQYASIGLIKAAAKFDPSRGLKFQTYAEHKIRGAILDGIRSETGRGLKQCPHPSLMLHISPQFPDDDLPPARDFRGQVEANIEIEKKQLPRDLEVLRMTMIEGHTFREAGAMLHLSGKRVWAIKQRAIRTITGTPNPARRPRFAKALKQAA